METYVEVFLPNSIVVCVCKPQRTANRLRTHVAAIKHIRGQLNMQGVLYAGVSPFCFASEVFLVGAIAII
jgi:hypothetical protein